MPILAVIWPAGANRTGLDIEVGMWLERSRRREAPLTLMFLQDRAARLTGGRMESQEQGARTRYYEDLLAYGAKAIVWSDWTELPDAVLANIQSSK